MGNNQLGQARKRRKKVRITDIAITKVPYTEYPGLTDTECKTIRAFAMEVLELSKEENDDNEVSITYCLEDRSIGICFGDEHGVNPLSDTRSAHLLMSGKPLTVVSLHNHPSTQSFSLEDIQFFIGFQSIRLMVLVSNQGVVHYLSKSDGYVPEKAYGLLHEHYKMIDKGMDVKNIIDITDKYLKKCSRVGIEYRKGKEKK